MQKISSLKLLVLCLKDNLYFLDELSPELADNVIFIQWYNNVRNTHFTQEIPEKNREDDETYKEITNDTFYEEDIFTTNEICTIILHDDLESLRKFASIPEFNANMSIGQLQYDVDKNICSATTLIEAAAYFGSEKCFKYLLLNGANTKVPSKRKNLAINAIIGGNLYIIQLLKEQNIDFAHCAKCAVEYHNNTLLEWIIQDKNLDGNLLLVAAQYNNFEAVEYCISKGIDINFRNQYKSTALHLAAAYDHPLMIKCLLLNSSIDIDAVNQKSITPLIISCERNSLRAFKVFDSIGSANYYVCKDKTPLLTAINERNFEIVEYILSSECKTKVDISQENEAFKMAIFAQNTLILKSFLEYGFDVNTEFPDGYTLIEWATQLNHIDDVKLIINWPGFSQKSLEKAKHIAHIDKRKEILDILMNFQK